MQTAFAWLLLPPVLCAGFGWSAWLLQQNPRRDGLLLTLCLALALSFGGLTLTMLWLSLLGGGFTVGAMVAVDAAVMLPGWVLWCRARSRAQLQTDSAGVVPATVHRIAGAVREPPLHNWNRFETWAALLLTAIAGAILFNAAYWPFSRADAVAIYHAQALDMSATHALIPLTGADSLYRAYPMAIQLGYTFVYLVSGWPNEYLARLIPALLSVGCLPVVFVLGRLISGSRLAGWTATLLLALTPTFGRWASAGYVDLPMAFFYALAAVFAFRLWGSRHWTDALLSGLLIGLAAWTKNAALIGVVLLAAWLVWAWLNRRIGWRLVFLSLTACALVAAPWYIRNLIGAGFIMPDTAWTDEARQTLDNLLIFVTHPEIFGATGPLLLLAWLATIVESLRTRRPGPTLLALWTVPFFGAWWVFASYDPRFLLLFLPLLAVSGGVWLVRVIDRVPVGWRRRLTVPAAALLLGLSGHIVWISVEFKDNMLRNPLMGHDARHEVVAGDTPTESDDP